MGCQGSYIDEDIAAFITFKITMHMKSNSEVCMKAIDSYHAMIPSYC